MKQKYLQSNQVKRTPVDYINESIIRELNPFVVQRMHSVWKLAHQYSNQIWRFLIGFYEQGMFLIRKM